MPSTQPSDPLAAERENERREEIARALRKISGRSWSAHAKDKFQHASFDAVGETAEAVTWIVANKDEILAALALPPLPQQGEATWSRPALALALEWFGQNRAMELHYSYGDEGDIDDVKGWCIYRRGGNRNDQTWTLVGHGATPEAALISALPVVAAKKPEV